MVFCAAFAVRFFGAGFHRGAQDGGWELRNALVLAVTLAPIAFSALVVLRFRAGKLSMRWLFASVLLDAALCTASLGTNVLYPGSLYRGILGIPDTAGLLVIMMAAGLRLSPRLALWGIGANCAGLGLLVVGDFTVCPKPDLDYSRGTVMMWPVFIFGAATFALLSATRTRSLAIHGAHESLKLERARQSLKTLLHGHHDAHALLTSATLNADLLARQEDGGREALQRAEDLRHDLALLRECVKELKQRADGELISAADAIEVSIDEQVRRIVEGLSSQLDRVRLVTRMGAPGMAAVVAGGAHGLTRILLNLLLNARDASGARSTSQIWIETEACDGGARLTVRDDGPGFTDHAAALPTTKLEGAGIGLTIVAAIAEASGGSVRLRNDHPHGARVEVHLPARSLTAS